MKNITVAAGVGDNIWVLQKLIQAQEQFNFIIPGNNPRRGKQVFDLLPQIGTAQYGDPMPFAHIKRKNAQAAFGTWHNIKKFHDFTLEANTHLEHGKRIEQWLPDLPTTFRIDWATTQADKYYGATIPENAIGIYGSAYSTQRAWGFWDEKEWLKLIKLCGPDYTYVIIGAEWDTDLGRNLMALLAKEKIKYVNTIGQSLGTVIEIMKRLHYFFSFPSGLGILATTVNCPVTMFYPNGRNSGADLRPMINAWAAPEDIESGIYKGCEFCTPEQIFKWCKENKWV